MLWLTYFVWEKLVFRAGALISPTQHTLEAFPKRSINVFQRLFQVHSSSPIYTFGMTRMLFPHGMKAIWTFLQMDPNPDGSVVGLIYCPELDWKLSFRLPDHCAVAYFSLKSLHLMKFLNDLREILWPPSLTHLYWQSSYYKVAELCDSLLENA